jgi:hypothetical protein
MRGVRFILALVLATSLIILPMSAGMAMSHVHASKTEMGMGTSGADCPCCNAAHKCAADTCMLKCFSVSALALEARPLMQPFVTVFAAVVMKRLVGYAPRPDPPPPRS